MKYAVAVAALVAGASASYNYTTEVVTAYTTYCPEATTLSYGSKTYTVTEVSSESGESGGARSEVWEARTTLSWQLKQANRTSLRVNVLSNTALRTITDETAGHHAHHPRLPVHRHQACVQHQLAVPHQHPGRSLPGWQLHRSVGRLRHRARHRARRRRHHRCSFLFRPGPGRSVCPGVAQDWRGFLSPGQRRCPCGSRRPRCLPVLSASRASTGGGTSARRRGRGPSSGSTPPTSPFWRHSRR